MDIASANEHTRVARFTHCLCQENCSGLACLNGEKCVAQQFGCLTRMFFWRVFFSERAQGSPNLRTGALPMLCVASFKDRLLGSEITHLKKPQRQEQQIMEKNAGALRAPLMGVLSPKKNRASLLHFVSSHCTRIHGPSVSIIVSRQYTASKRCVRHYRLPRKPFITPVNTKRSAEHTDKHKHTRTCTETHTTKPSTRKFHSV